MEQSRIYSFLNLVVAFCLIVGSISRSPAQRLPTTVLPEHYAISLTPDLKLANYSGIEIIDVTLTQPTKTITLNAIEITFDTVRIRSAGKEQNADVSLDTNRQQAIIAVSQQLPSGKARIEIHFAGTLNNELRGFYLSRAPRRDYAVTQFEPTDARRAFPCFDEPALKATYDISLTIDSNDTAISNTAISSDAPGPGYGKHTVRFETTPKMSTYLLAFLVGDFQCTSSRRDEVTIRVCSTPDKVELTHYAMDVARFVLHYYNSYFGIRYPLKKLDLIALPDFAAGAMENFGAITYREDALLLDYRSASFFSRKGVATHIAHEIAHQWFGDLVTMQWWDNLWLNEGLATWMANKPLANLHPEWGLAESVVSNFDRSLNLDASTDTRTIRAKADTPDKINQMFDGVTYGKASDVLLTVENYVGEKTFRHGIRNYLAAHLYGNASAEDFWDAETTVSHKRVDSIMKSLVTQPGEAVLTFGEPSSGSVSVTQRRFFLSPSIRPDPTQKWTLPVCFKSADNHQSCQLLTPTTTTLGVRFGGLPFANAHGKGYYRTLYPRREFEVLLSHVETALAPAERIRFLGDEWALVRANQAKMSDYLALIAALKADSSSEVISACVAGIDEIYRRVAVTQVERDALASWIRLTFSPELARLGDPSSTDSPNTSVLRSKLFYLVGLYGKDSAVLTRARATTDAYLADPSSEDATLALTAGFIATRYGDASLFDKLQNIYETSDDPNLKSASLFMLGNFANPELVSRALNYAVSSKVRSQDAVLLIAGAMDVDSSRDTVWDFIQNNWNRVQAKLTTSLGAYLVESTGAFCSAGPRDDVLRFFGKHNVPSSSASLTHAINHINECMEFRRLQQPSLDTWLNTKRRDTAM